MTTETEITTETRIAALRHALDEHDAEPEEVAYRDNLYEIGNREYLVLTDEEADDEARENILRDLWAFRADFLLGHLPEGMTTEALQAIQEKLCEAATEPIRAMIKDLDHFVDDAIAADGRGHFLAGYDGEEAEVEIDGTDFYVYRVN